MTLPSVQELVKEPMLTIPAQYLRDDQEPRALPDNGSVPVVPVVDMKKLLADETMQAELETLHSSCKEWGIFQLVNHGLIVDELNHEIEGFFKLSLEEKERYQLKPGEVEGYGQTRLFEAKDEKVDWADKFYMTVNPVHRRKKHLLPLLPSSLRESVEEYMFGLQEISRTLFRLMAKALNIEAREMEILEDGVQAVKMIYYPPCPQPDKVMGVFPHSDPCAITILLEINGVGGLEAKKDGVWVPVKFLPDALVVNLGDIMEILSNGLYKSSIHRAIVNSAKERISTAVFMSPKFEAEIGPLTTLLSPDNPPLFKRLGMEDYDKGFYALKYGDKSNLDRMRIV